MNIVLDKREKDIIYVDKANNHVADTDEVVKLVNKDNDDPVDVYIKIISTTNNLNEAEIAVLRYLIYNTNAELVPTVCNEVSKELDKAPITISRAIDSLRKKRVVYINALNYVVVSNTIAVSICNIYNAKFLVVELRPKDTSGDVTI